jgi:hypothetical protein
MDMADSAPSRFERQAVAWEALLVESTKRASEPLQEEKDTAAAALPSEDPPAPTTSPCLGYTEAFLQSNKRIANKDKAIQGFFHVCGEGMHNMASAVIDRLRWKYGNTICGVVRSDSTDLYTVSCSVSNTKTFEYAIHSISCSGSVTEGGRSMCDLCFNVSRSFYRRCYSAAEVRETKVSRKAKHSTINNPTLFKQQRTADLLEIRSLRAKVTRLRAKSQRKHGVRLPDGMQDLFDDETEGLAHQYFEKKNVSDDDFNKIM